jgi:hypothetical protein
VNLKGGEKMKLRLITAVMLTLFLGSMLIASVAACPVKPLKCKPLRCELSLGLTQTGWAGSVTGGIVGDYTWTMVKYTMKDTKEYYFGTWVIDTDNGEISGFDMGVFDYATGEWWALGKVTAATESWRCLVGSFMWNGGTVSVVDETVTGAGTLTIVPC